MFVHFRILKTILIGKIKGHLSRSLFEGQTDLLICKPKVNVNLLLWLNSYIIVIILL